MLQVLEGKVAWEVCLFFSIYLFNYLFISSETYKYFIIWVVSQYDFILLLKLFQLWQLRLLSFGSWVPFTYSHQCGVFFFNSSLLSGSMRGPRSFCAFFFAWTPKWATFLRYPVSFYWRIILETGNLELNVLTATRVSFLRLAEQSDKCVYIIFIHIPTIFPNVTICIYIKLSMSSYWCSYPLPHGLSSLIPLLVYSLQQWET